MNRPGILQVIAGTCTQKYVVQIDSFIRPLQANLIGVFTHPA